MLVRQCGNCGGRAAQKPWCFWPLCTHTYVKYMVLACNRVKEASMLLEVLLGGLGA